MSSLDAEVCRKLQIGPQWWIVTKSGPCHYSPRPPAEGSCLASIFEPDPSVSTSTEAFELVVKALAELEVIAEVDFARCLVRLGIRRAPDVWKSCPWTKRYVGDTWQLALCAAVVGMPDPCHPQCVRADWHGGECNGV